jgi:hypothetical protein
VTSNDFINPEPSQRLALERDEHCPLGIIGAVLRQELFEQGNGLLPQGANAPFVTFSVKMNPRLTFQFQVFVAEIGDFLNSRTSVVKKQQQNAIAQGG